MVFSNPVVTTTGFFMFTVQLETALTKLNDFNDLNDLNALNDCNALNHCNALNNCNDQTLSQLLRFPHRCRRPEEIRREFFYVAP